MAEASISPLLADRRVDESKKSKKRRRADDSNNALVGGLDRESPLSKEERREAKRLRKLAKLSGADQDIHEAPTIGSGVGIFEDAAANAGQREGKPSKEARKAAREWKKLTKRVEKAVIENSKVDIAIPESVPVMASDHSSRKAEKARLNATNGPSKSTPGYVEDPTLRALPQSEIDDFLSTNFIAITDPISSTTLRPITHFSQLPSYTAATSSSPFTAFKSPTPIQSAAWPFLLSGRDVIGVAETGSGKTLAFGVPCIRSITNSSKPKGSPARAVIVSPTRELAAQIHAQMETLASPANLSTVCIHGGIPKPPQRLALMKAHIIVATPGRLNDLINEDSADLSNVNYLVLDEADRMLDKGFEEEVRRIIAAASNQNRQTLMFTATWPPTVRALASTFMQNPVHISIGANNPTHELRANAKITQVIEVIAPHEKETRLLQLIKQHAGTPSTTHQGQHHKDQNPRILIFCLYKKEAERITHLLQTRIPAHPVAAIHGSLTQSTRTAALSSFKAGTTPLLVATDVASRGLDIPSVKLVINVTFPLTVEDYVHRIGRTGRAGATDGLAVTLFTEHDKALSGGLVNVLRAAGQEVPESLLRFGTTVKKKGHEAYGAFYKEVGVGGKKEGTKIRFD